MDQAVCKISVGAFLKKYAFVKILFRICRVGIGKPCIFKSSPGEKKKKATIDWMVYK